MPVTLCADATALVSRDCHDADVGVLRVVLNGHRLVFGDCRGFGGNHGAANFVGLRRHFDCAANGCLCLTTENLLVKSGNGALLFRFAIVFAWNHSRNIRRCRFQRVVRRPLSFLLCRGRYTVCHRLILAGDCRVRPPSFFLWADIDRCQRVRLGCCH